MFKKSSENAHKQVKEQFKNTRGKTLCSRKILKMLTNKFKNSSRTPEAKRYVQEKF